jgi:hypothetical protein
LLDSNYTITTFVIVSIGYTVTTLTM